MNIVVITGPSGSGKSNLSSKISKIFNDCIIIKTDSYYRDNFYIKFLSIFISDIYDRIISLKKKELINTITSIKNKEETTYIYRYDFKHKKSIKIKENINNNNNRFIILEGIFFFILFKIILKSSLTVSYA